MATNTADSTAPYSGYYHRDVPEPDTELTHVGPGTICGEYLRRYWQPVGLSAELKDLPQAVRILGEDLVLFRDGQGRVGLLAAHCSHRGTSLEFGTIQQQGIRCCYHGWLYGVDGRILETPGESADSTLKDRFCHGAYPTLEHKGLVFTYMGPPNERPAFPILDSFDTPGYRAVAERQSRTPCNWLQLAENNADPVHLVYLHRLEELRSKLDRHRPSVDPAHSMDEFSGVGLAEWEEEFREIRDDTRHSVIEWHETEIGMLWAWARRVNDLVWVRIADFIPPNIDQIPRSLPLVEESEELMFDPPRTTSWTVPVDDTNTMGFGYQYALESGYRQSRFQFTGTYLGGRSYDERQRQPGDYEGQVSQRPIAVHALEHLAWSDTGVLTVRKLIREGVHRVRNGDEPARPAATQHGAIPTYARSTVLRIPPAATPEADRALLRATARRVMSGEFPKPTAGAVGAGRA